MKSKVIRKKQLLLNLPEVILVVMTPVSLIKTNRNDLVES